MAHGLGSRPRLQARHGGRQRGIQWNQEKRFKPAKASARDVIKVTIVQFLVLANYIASHGSCKLVPRTIVDAAKRALKARSKARDWYHATFMKGGFDDHDTVEEDNSSIAILFKPSKLFWTSWSPFSRRRMMPSRPRHPSQRYEQTASSSLKSRIAWTMNFRHCQARIYRNPKRNQVV